MFGSIPVWEMLVLVIVVVATLSLGTPQPEKNEQALEVTAISGTMTLTSRTSMNAFGLQDFKIGPLATINLSVHPIQSQGCMQCESIPTGFHINGDVTISQLIDAAGRSGRVEGTLNITYLRESSSSHHTVREWFNIDWDAGPASAHWVVMLYHSPAKWSPSQDFSSTFLETPFGFESRTGPYTFFSPLTDSTREIEGCLPGGFSCSKATQRDYSMIANFTEPRTPNMITHPENWNLVNVTETSELEPESMGGVRELLSLESKVTLSQTWAPEINASLTAMGAWDINVSNTPNFSPMTSLFQALGLPSISYDVPGGTWVEAEYSQYNTGFIMDERGNLILTLQHLN